MKLAFRRHCGWLHFVAFTIAHLLTYFVYSFTQANPSGNDSSTGEYLQLGSSFHDFGRSGSSSTGVLYRAEPGEILRLSGWGSGGFSGRPSGRSQGQLSGASRSNELNLEGLNLSGQKTTLRSLANQPSDQKTRWIGTRLPETRGYIDLPDNEVTTIYREPGKSWRDCSSPSGTSSVCIGWPHNRADLKILDSRLVEVIDPFTGERRWQNHYRVRFSYTPQGKNFVQSGEGWISSQYVTTTPVRSAKKSKSVDDCETKESKVGATRTNTLVQLQSSLNEAALEQVARSIAPHAGQCLMDPLKPLKEAKTSSSPFDAVVMPHYRTMQVPDVELPSGQKLTREQLMSIDALARTIYGEMASCWGQGSHYLTGVAAIARNRADLVADNHPKRRIFVRNPSSEKPAMVQVLSDPYQFSAWNARINGAPNPSLRHVMCPPARADQVHWTGGRPSRMEQEIWNRSLRIATEAVAMPDHFKKRTSEIKYFYYTSGLGFFLPGFSKVTPSVDGMRLSRSRCIEIWHRPNHP